MNNSALNEARANVAAARAALAADEAEIAEGERLITVLQEQIAQLRQRQVQKGLRAALAAAETALNAAEEAAVQSITLELAGEIVKRQTSDPLRHSAWVIENVMKLRGMICSELDTPITEKYSQHPLLTQALALVPPLDGVDRPVFDLGYVAVNETDWPSRRRAILAAAESAPLAAA